jgi:hypothetical protein
MSVTIEGFTTDSLQAQPFSYEGDARSGRTATTVELVGLVKPSEWLTLKGVYDTWRDVRITDQDTEVSQSVGTTVTVSASANGATWTNKECWFTEAPTGEQVGALVRVSATLVDATEAVEVSKALVDKALTEDLITFGTFTLGSATILMTEFPKSRLQNANFELTATGNALISGSTVPVEVRNVVGILQTGTADDVLTWYDSALTALPVTTAYFPSEPPEFSSEPVLASGAKTTRTTVSISLIQIP